MGIDDFLIEPSYFWPRTSIYITVTTINLLTVLLYFIYSRKYIHIRAKDPKNLLVIFLAGQSQSWAHFLYSLPIYNETDASVTLCITVGYIFQHLFGTSLLFYCLFSRLIKHGAIFHAFEGCFHVFERCFRCIDLNISQTAWTKDAYAQKLRRRYKIILFMLFGIILIPMIIFILSSYSTGAISVDNDTDLCSTDPTWKVVFVTFNLFYFVTLSFMLCFIPRFIKKQQFNETLQLRDSVIFATVIFCVEVWVGFREDNDVQYWYTVSNMLMFSIPTFIICRIFWYSLYKAIRGDQYYEATFKNAIRNKRRDDQSYVNIVVNMDFDNKMTTGLLDYCERYFENEVITIIAPAGSASNNVKVKQLTSFVYECLTLKSGISKCKAIPDSTSDVQTLNGLKAMYNRIVKTYIADGVIPVEDYERDKFKELGSDDELENGLIRKALLVFGTLYQHFYTGFRDSEDICRIENSDRMDQESITATGELYGISEQEFNQFDDVELDDIQN